MIGGKRDCGNEVVVALTWLPRGVLTRQSENGEMIIGKNNKYAEKLKTYVELYTYQLNRTQNYVVTHISFWKQQEKR